MGSPLAVVVAFEILSSVFAVRENTLKSLVTMHGHLNCFMYKVILTLGPYFTFCYVIVWGFLHSNLNFFIRNAKMLLGVFGLDN